MSKFQKTFKRSIVSEWKSDYFPYSEVLTTVNQYDTNLMENSDSDVNVKSTLNYPSDFMINIAAAINRIYNRYSQEEKLIYSQLDQFLKMYPDPKLQLKKSDFGNRRKRRFV